jgi:RND family efflux transporter MFP subunit
MISGAKRALCALSAAALICLSGCSTDESAYKRNTIETVREAARAEYNFTTVKRGDITMTESIRVEYFAARQENLGFDISGLYYDQINVSVGDEVKAGDILATLECSQLDQSIARFEAQKEALETDIRRNQALLDLLSARAADDSPRRREYETAIRDARGECAVADAELYELEEKRAGRVLTASIDGVVTFVRDVAPGESSVKGRTILTVTDLDSCAFATTVQYPEALDRDAIYTVTIDGSEYELALSSAEELGIEVEPLNEKSTRTQVFFRLLTPGASLASGASGKINVTVDSRENVLFLPVAALTTVDGVPSVYVPDENGLGTVRNVEVGFNTGKYVEITGGLNEGDSVILY